MAWQNLQEDVLEEFGAFVQSYDGDNRWLEQASAAREYDRQRKFKTRQEKIAAGECLDCREPARVGVRCTAHRAIHNERRRLEPVGDLDRAKQAIAERAAARRAAWPESKKRAVEARAVGFKKYMEEREI